MKDKDGYEVGDLVQQIVILDRRAIEAEERIAALEGRVLALSIQDMLTGRNAVSGDRVTIKRMTLEDIKKVVIDKYPDCRYTTRAYFRPEEINRCDLLSNFVSEDSLSWSSTSKNKVWVMAYNSIVSIDNALPLDYFDNE